MADTGGEFQPISADFDRETEAFDFFRMLKSEMMTFEEIREAILPTLAQKGYLLEAARPIERKILVKIFKAREETWNMFRRFAEDKRAVAEFEKKWKKHRSQGAERANRNTRKRS